MENPFKVQWVLYRLVSEVNQPHMPIIVFAFSMVLTGVSHQKGTQGNLRALGRGSKDAGTSRMVLSF